MSEKTEDNSKRSEPVTAEEVRKKERFAQERELEAMLAAGVRNGQHDSPAKVAPAPAPAKPVPQPINKAAMADEAQAKTAQNQPQPVDLNTMFDLGSPDQLVIMMMPYKKALMESRAQLEQQLRMIETRIREIDNTIASVNKQIAENALNGTHFVVRDRFDGCATIASKSDRY